LALESIKEFQGSLKNRTKKDIEKIQQSLLKYGFSMPFFIWNNSGNNYCLDGHGRYKALSNLQKKGYDLPQFPVVFVKAKNEIEAKKKLLLINSHYGNITQRGLEDFISVENIDFDIMNVTISKEALAKAFQDDGDINEKAVTFPVIIAMNNDEYKNIKSLKEKLKIKTDEKLIQELIRKAIHND